MDSAIGAALAPSLAPAAAPAPGAPGTKPYKPGKLLMEDDFTRGLAAWVVEQTSGGSTKASNGKLEIDGGGCTVWFRQTLASPVMIEYVATAIQRGGPNDNCRDINCFWMARHPKTPHDLFNGFTSSSESRGGDFDKYHELRGYYVGFGGHQNTTSRFRRYTGFGARPLLPEHDLKSPRFRIVPNRPMRIQVVACGEVIQWILDGEVVFDLRDPFPYPTGWFGLRTVANHMTVEKFKVYQLEPEKSSARWMPPGSAARRTAAALGLSQGLHELSWRRGWRDIGLAKRGDEYLSERTVFRDPKTGGTVWRLTRDPSSENNEYTDIPVWSANGETMLFVTNRRGRAERWLMDANGGKLRPIPATGGKPTPRGYWSILYPDLFYFAEVKGQQTTVYAGNLKTGERKEIVRVGQALGEMQPPHPTEEWFLFGDLRGAKREQTDQPSLAYIVGRDGSVQKVGFEKRYHRLRFTKSPDRRIFYNFDKPRASFTVLPDGSGRTPIPHQGGHPDWTPDGSWLFFNAYEGNILGVRYDACRYDGSELHTAFPYGGHASATLDGEGLVTDGGPESGMISHVRIDSAATRQTLAMVNTSRYDHTNTWHPEHHSTHPHPNSSPDATKVVFNSDMLAQYTDIYVAVARYPDPPRELQASTASGLVRLSWSKPRRCLETRGYLVYRSAASGLGYECLTAEPLQATQWQGPAGSAPGYFVVTALEYSGLESSPSNEVYCEGNGAWKGPARIMLEAEFGRLELPVEERVDMQSASNGYCVACRDSRPGGSVTLRAELPKNANYALWVRLRGKGAIRVACQGDWGEIESAAGQWQWRRLASTRALSAGAHEVALRPTTGGEAVDKILLTDDEHFKPSGVMGLDSKAPGTPAGLRLIAAKPNALHLSWEAVRATDFDHYNVYAGKTQGFQCNHAALVGSPVEPEFIDWGLELNTGYYYRVTAVDRSGNESPPAPVLAARTEQFEPIRICLKPREARASNMSVAGIQQLGLDALQAGESGAASAEWTFQCTREGAFAIWGRSTHAQKEAAAFDLVIDGNTKIRWTVFGMWGEWLWSPAGQTVDGTPECFFLSAGEHTVRLVPRTPRAKLLEIMITDDPSWWPVEEMKVVGF